MYRPLSLFGYEAIGIDPTFADVSRRWLDDCSYVDVCAGWLRGPDAALDVLYEHMRWRRRTVRMYERILDEPRVTSWWSVQNGNPEPLPVLADARAALGERYDRTFDSIGFNFYRHRHDSVAWHRDRHQQYVTDPVVAIVTLGPPRPFKLRPYGGGSSLTFTPGHGDLLVMAGSCQHRWEHSVPKVSKPTGARLSVTFRHGIDRSNLNAITTEEVDPDRVE